MLLNANVVTNRNSILMENFLSSLEYYYYEYVCRSFEISAKINFNYCAEY